MEASANSQLQEKIRRLEQELDSARVRVSELEKEQHAPSSGHISQTDVALRENEERLRFVTEQSPDNIFIQDRDFRYVWVSKPAHPLTIEEYLGRTDFDLVPPEDAQKLTELKKRVLAEGRPVSAEIPLQLRGEERIFHAIYKPWRDAQDSVIGLAGYVRDITNRKQAEESLRKSEERYRTLFESIDEGFCVFEMLFDAGGKPVDYRWLEINPAFERHTGLVNALDKTARELVPNLENKWVEIYGRIAMTGQPERFKEYSEAMGRWFEVYAFRIGEPEQRHVALLFTDVTERKRAEEALQRTAARYEQQVRLFEGVASTTPDFVYIFDLQGRFLYANKRLLEVWGMKLPDAVGKTCRELGYEQWHHDMHMREIAQVIETKRPIKGEVPFEAPLTGIFGVYEYIFTPVIGPDGEVELIAGTTRDITDRKHAEDALTEAKAAAEEATRAKSEFLANMSHEIRTPMTVFMAAIEHLLQIDRSPERRHLLGMADQSAQRLRTLIDGVLDLSRIEARRVDLEGKPFDLRATVRAAVDLFLLPAREKTLRLEMEIAPDVPGMVAGDPDKIGQVLINLIGNAVKFTHQGEVRVCVGTRGESLEFAVADTGIGIPEEKQHLLFQSFSQVGSSLTSRFGGSGLGLAISKGIVELMGGEISVQSRTGAGSVFTFILPLRKAEIPNAPLPETAPEDSGKENHSARILLAEDEPMIREMITMMLAQRGLHPDTAESGRQAVEKWQDGNFDLILMDLQMPEMDGLEATQAIRERETEGQRRTCIIGLTGHASREIREQCLDSGMDQVLTKPVKIKDLLSAVDTCL